MNEGRPQDQDRPHRRKGQPSPETTTLLAEYQAAMRDELRAVLAELRGKAPDPGMLDGATFAARVSAIRPSLTDRMRLWDLGIKIGRELGTEVDPAPATPPPSSPPAGPRRRSRVDFGGA